MLGYASKGDRAGSEQFLVSPLSRVEMLLAGAVAEGNPSPSPLVAAAACHLQSSEEVGPGETTDTGIGRDRHVVGGPREEQFVRRHAHTVALQFELSRLLAGWT